MSEPSSEWTPEERLAMIASIASKACRSLAIRPYQDLKSIFDTMERIAFLAGMPTEFIENNRDHIVNGQFRLQEQR